MKYSDQQRIQKIYENATKLYNYILENKLKKEDLLSEFPLQWLVTTPLYNIGEQTYNLSDSFRMEHNSIPWAKISGLRHRLVHDYDSTNWSLICSILFDVLPSFFKDISALQSELSKS